MQTRYFRVNKKEYCHITGDSIFIFNSKSPGWVPEEHELGEAWGIFSILNYIVFFFLFAYTAVSIMYYGGSFFTEWINYGGLLLLFLSLRRIQEGLHSSKTPTIPRDKIKNVVFRTPRFSYPRLFVYFEGPEGKVLRRRISVLYKQEALPVLRETGVLRD